MARRSARLNGSGNTDDDIFTLAGKADPTKLPSNQGNGNDFALDNISVTDLTPGSGTPAPPETPRPDAPAPGHLAQTGAAVGAAIAAAAVLAGAGILLALLKRSRA